MGGTVSTGGDGAAEVMALVEAFEIDELDEVEGLADAVIGTVTFAAGEIMCAEGDESGSWWVVLGGNAVVTVGGERVGAVTAGEVVGEVSALADARRVATVTATTLVTAIEIDGSGFTDLVLGCPPAARALLRTMAGRLRGVDAVVAGGGV